MTVKFNRDSFSCSFSSGRTLSSHYLLLTTPRRKTESSNILLKPNFATPKQKKLDNLSGNKRTRSYSLRFQKKHNIGILSGTRTLMRYLSRILPRRECGVTFLRSCLSLGPIRIFGSQCLNVWLKQFLLRNQATVCNILFQESNCTSSVMKCVMTSLSRCTTRVESTFTSQRRYAKASLQDVEEILPFQTCCDVLVPMLNILKSTSGVLMFCNDLHEAKGDSEDESFKAYACSCIFSIFLQKLQKKMKIEELRTKSGNIYYNFSKLISFDKIWRLQEYIEGPLCQYFSVNRINFCICDHNKNQLFKVVRDGKNHEQKIISYESDKGIANSVAKDGIPIVENEANDTKKFLAELDDPKGKYYKFNQPASQVSILSVPVYKSSKSSISSNCLGRICSCSYSALDALKLINKDNGTPFDENDLEEAKEFCYSLGDIITVVSKAETLMSFKNYLGSLEQSLGEASNEMQSNWRYIKSLKENMKSMDSYLKGVLRQSE
ncbi:unnamed protein product [Moneuplotes crassus]|uniref:Uncharacterized protein n=1 Tax=Euplotes crassus TaxID=5936 RepID=A0AAD1X8R4_EUPCR|nr:unnamed protein product [Moneuplotes crassus]